MEIAVACLTSIVLALGTGGKRWRRPLGPDPDRVAGVRNRMMTTSLIDSVQAQAAGVA